jgi:phage/plasmid-associated DNA primase
MLDFFTIATRTTKRGTVEVYPKFKMNRSDDLMIRGGDFYAVWVEDRGLWSTDEQDVINLIDHEINRYIETHKGQFNDTVKPLYMWDAESGMIDVWHKYCQRQCRDNFTALDEKLIFSNTETNKKDFASKRLNYPLEKGSIEAWDKLISTLYTEEERHKIEWAIGAIVTGDSKKIQKFMVFYGEAGTGKSTILNVIQQLFEGYHTVFDAKALGSSNNAFALESFKTNPLVAIQHDGDLSRIEDNTRLNSLVSHETMPINEKFKGLYNAKFNCFLFMGTNKPVKITDGKSGLLRRLIDVSPSGKKLGIREYKKATKQVEFELGAIAHHCREVYLADPGAYDAYVPTGMMGATNDFYNYVLDSYHVFRREDGTTLKAAWEMYKTYVEEAKVSYPFSQRTFKEELKNYFKEFNERFATEDGNRLRSYYRGFRLDKFEDTTQESRARVTTKAEEEAPKQHLIEFDAAESIFDKECAGCFAQYASSKETPTKKWEKVTATLSQLDTRKLHYVKVPENHIVIDFDLKDESGKKSFKLNLEEASKWPATYAELSKSGAGIHLHYIYTGDVTKLSRIFDDNENIEIKVFTGKSSLRRMLTKCNSVPIATISSGLPLKGDGKVINFDGIKNEKMLRTLLRRNLAKEYGSTRCSIDFIYNNLEDAYNSGLCYDVSDMKNAVFAFAANSTNQADYCIKKVSEMKFKSEEPSDNVANDEAPIVFYDVEVFSNLFVVCWKYQGKDNPVVKMINPTPTDIEKLIRCRLIGFNNRRYDDHILYARLLGYTNEQLYDLSQRIINGDRNAMFTEAYNLSYTDIYDFAATKMSLKKWEIELGSISEEKLRKKGFSDDEIRIIKSGTHHQELGLSWDEPAPEELWTTVADYCVNDVVATESVFTYLKADWIARQILADLAGMAVNSTTNSLTTRIIFGRERRPKLVYTDLATGKQTIEAEGLEKPNVVNAFPGYEYINGKNMYRGTDIGRGGYIISNPGIYTNVALLDVASLHPNSIRAMNCFGEYTKNFTDIIDARVAIKHGDLDAARKMLDGRLAPYLDDESKAKDLAQALKIAINSVYGLTAASFDNPFRDIRNVNNIVALRGALMMRTLQDEVEGRGFKIVAIKTDSIKIANATKDIIDYCMGFAKKYGYTFEHEATYDRICQVNDADYIAKYASAEWCEKTYGYVPGDNKKYAGEWTATGKQFQIPYTFKKLFSKEPIEFDDLCETKEVKTAIYLDRNEKLPDGEHDYQFIGKVGNFCPIKPGHGGGVLVREAKDKDGNTKYDSVTGTLKKDKTPYRWLEAEFVRTLGKEDIIDLSYYHTLVDAAIYGSGTGKNRKPGISDFGDFERFVADEPYIVEDTVLPDFPLDDDVPWDWPEGYDDYFNKR